MTYACLKSNLGGHMFVISSASALISANALNSATYDANKASERISTGKRINRASDDPSGLVRAMSLKADISSYTKALDNINEGVNAMDKIATTLASIYDILTEMRTLADSAISETDADTITSYRDDFDQYVSDIGTLSDQVTVAGAGVMDGTPSSVTIQVGISTTSTRTFDYVNTSASTLTVSGLDFADTTETYSDAIATAAVSAVDTALDTVESYIATIAAQQRVLDINTDFVNSMIKNESIAYGKIMDANIARETADMAAAQIRQTSAAAMLAQSNSMNKDIVLYLLKGYNG
jgi:flagellin